MNLLGHRQVVLGACWLISLEFLLFVSVTWACFFFVRDRSFVRFTAVLNFFDFVRSSCCSCRIEWVRDDRCLWGKCVFHHFARVVVKWSKLNIMPKRLKNNVYNNTYSIITYYTTLLKSSSCTFLFEQHHFLISRIASLINGKAELCIIWEKYVVSPTMRKYSYHSTGNDWGAYQ